MRIDTILEDILETTVVEMDVLLNNGFCNMKKPCNNNSIMFTVHEFIIHMYACKLPLEKRNNSL